MKEKKVGVLNKREDCLVSHRFVRESESEREREREMAVSTAHNCYPSQS